MISKFKDKEPKIGKNVFVAENAAVIGDVTLGDNCSVWHSASVRGDIEYIKIGNDTNVQDNSSLHVTAGTGPLNIGDNVTIGHNVVLHGCTIADNVLVGMNATILDNAEIGKGSIIGANSLICEKKKIPPRSLVLGAPGKVVRKISDSEYQALKENGQHYVELAHEYLKEK